MSSEGHIVIAGGGRVGRRVANRFAERGRAVTIIEKQRAEIESAAHDAIEVIPGDATRPPVLESAFRPDTSVLGALTDRGDTNLAICLVGKRLDDDVRTVARINDEYGDEYEGYVDKVFFPERASIKAAVNAVSGSDVRTFEDVTGRLEVLDIQVGYDAPIKSKRLSEVDWPEGAVVVSDAKGDVTVGSDTKLVAGRRYIVAAENEVVDDVLRLFQG